MDNIELIGISYKLRKLSYEVVDLFNSSGIYKEVSTPFHVYAGLNDSTPFELVGIKRAVWKTLKSELQK